MNLAGAYLGAGFFFSEAGLALLRRSTKSPTSRKLDANSLRLLWIVNTVSIGAGVWLALHRIGPRLPGEAACGWIGVGIFAVGTVLRWTSIYYLGRYFTVDVAVAEEHRVVDSGPYRWIRHPSYAGLLLQFAGLGMTFGTVFTLVVVAIPPFLTLLYRIQIEETALRAGLGEAYVTYAQRTKRLVPWLY